MEICSSMRSLAYFLGAGIVTIVEMLLFRFCSMCQQSHEDGSLRQTGAFRFPSFFFLVGSCQLSVDCKVHIAGSYTFMPHIIFCSMFAANLEAKMSRNSHVNEDFFLSRFLFF